MSSTGDWPGDETAETRVMALPAQERELLAALAVVGRASLSHDELAELLRVNDVTPLVRDLEARGLIRSDERRCSVAGRIGEDLRRMNDALSTGDRLLGYMATLGESGRLTPGRLADDSAAILGLSEWAAEMQRSTQLLEMVKSVEASYETAHRVEEWRELLKRGRGAAHALGDRQSEIWMLRRLATASAMAGDSAGAQQYLREADELQRAPQTTQQRTAMTEPAGAAAAGDNGNTWKIVLAILGTVLLALIGVGVGYAIGSDTGGSSETSTTTVTSTTGTTGTETVQTTVFSTTTLTTTVTTPGTTGVIP